MFYTSVTTVVVTMMRMIIINIMKMMIRPTFCECTKLCMSGEFLKKSDQALLVNIRWRLVIKILWDSLIWKWEMKKHFFAFWHNNVDTGKYSAMSYVQLFSVEAFGWLGWLAYFQNNCTITYFQPHHPFMWYFVASKNFFFESTLSDG